MVTGQMTSLVLTNLLECRKDMPTQSTSCRSHWFSLYTAPNIIISSREL